MLIMAIWVRITVGYVLESDPQCNDLKEVKTKVLKVSIPLLVTIYKCVFQLQRSASTKVILQVTRKALYSR